MRLWHEALLPLLPRQQLLGQHRECCALRGLNWGKKHAVVDYVFLHPREYLSAYHMRVMDEMERRGYNVEALWRCPGYRGKRCPPFAEDPVLMEQCLARTLIYPEHTEGYLQQCLENLSEKGVIIRFTGKGRKDE